MIYSYGVKTNDGEWFQGWDMNNDTLFGANATMAWGSRSRDEALALAKFLKYKNEDVIDRSSYTIDLEECFERDPDEMCENCDCWKATRRSKANE